MRETIPASSYESPNPTSACNRRCRCHGAARAKGLEQVFAQTLRQFRSQGSRLQRGTHAWDDPGERKKTAAELREGNRPPKVRAASALYRSHAARHHQFTRVMDCQGSESTYLIGTFRVWPVVNMIAYQALTESRATSGPRSSCTMYTALAWGFVAFTAAMLWLAWLDRQERRAVARRTPPRTSS